MPGKTWVAVMIGLEDLGPSGICWISKEDTLALVWDFDIGMHA